MAVALPATPKELRSHTSRIRRYTGAFYMVERSGPLRAALENTARKESGPLAQEPRYRAYGFDRILRPSRRFRRRPGLERPPQMPPHRIRIAGTMDRAGKSMGSLGNFQFGRYRRLS